jgi:hypothetical protein
MGKSSQDADIGADGGDDGDTHGSHKRQCKRPRSPSPVPLSFLHHSDETRARAASAGVSSGADVAGAGTGAVSGTAAITGRSGVVGDDGPRVGASSAGGFFESDDSASTTRVFVQKCLPDGRKGVLWHACICNPLAFTNAMRTTLPLLRHPSGVPSFTFNVVCNQGFEGIRFAKEIRSGVVVHGMVPADEVRISMSELAADRRPASRVPEKTIGSIPITVPLADLTKEVFALKPSSRLLLWGTVDMLMFSVADGNSRTVATGIRLTSDGEGNTGKLRSLTFMNRFYIPSSQLKGDMVKASAKFASEAVAGVQNVTITVYDVNEFAEGHLVLASSGSGSAGVMFNPIIITPPVALESGPEDDDSAYHSKTMDLNCIPMKEEHLERCPRVFSAAFKLDVLTDILKNVPEASTLVMRVNGTGGDRNKCTLEVNLADPSEMRHLCRVVFILSF